MGCTPNSRKNSGGAAVMPQPASTSPSSFSTGALIKVIRRLIEISEREERRKNVVKAFADAKCPLAASAPGTDPPQSSSTAAAVGSPSDGCGKKRVKTPASAVAGLEDTSAAIPPAPVAGASPVPVHADCYWVVLGTHLMNNLIQHLHDVCGGGSLADPMVSPPPTSPPSKRMKTHQVPASTSTSIPTSYADFVAEIIAVLSYLTTTILISDKERLESACSSSAPCRSILGRSIVSSTAGAVWALEILGRSLSNYCTNDSQVEDALRFRRCAFFAALQAVDRSVHMSLNPKQSDLCGLNSIEIAWTVFDLDYFSASPDVERVGFLSSITSVTDEESVWSCLTALDQEEARFTAAGTGPGKGSESPPTPATTPKRSTRRSTKSHRQQKNTEISDTSGAIVGGEVANHLSALLPSVFEVLMKSAETNIRMEGRIAVRRWASMVLVWLCHGQPRLLRTAYLLLSSQLASSSQTFAWSASLTSSRCLPIPDSAFLVAVSCRIIAIVSESGNFCGARSPTGGMDTFMRALSKEKDKKRKSKPARAEIRDWAVVVMCSLLRLHGKSLDEMGQENCPTIVNDIDDEKSMPTRAKTSSGTAPNDGDMQHLSTNGACTFFPEMHDVINNLCRSAAVSAGGPFSTEQSTWTKHFLTLASALVMQLVSKSNGPMDCKLVNFAVVRLVDVTQTLFQNGVGGVMSSGSEMDVAELVARFSLNAPLDFSEALASPKATSATRGRKRAATPEKTEIVAPFGLSAFIPDVANVSNEDVMALFIRATLNAGTDPSERPASALVASLIEVVRRTYDTRNFENAPRITLPNTPDGNSNDDKRQTTPMEAKLRKRQRGNHVKGSGGSNNKTLRDFDGPRRLNSSRASLAMETLKILSSCLTVHPAPASILLRSFRKSLTTEHFRALIGLGEALDAVMVKTRALFANLTRVPVPDPPIDSMAFISVAGSYDFTHYERNLWLAHIKLCHVLGRGTASYDESRSIPHSAKPILINSECRLTIFKHVAASHGCVEKGWPLSLPAPHYALCVANMTTEPISTEHNDSVADCFVVDGCIDSIARLLDDLGDLKSHDMQDPDRLYIDDEIPLSLRDARIFLLAASRLPLDDRLLCFEKLLTIIDQALLSGQKKELTRSAIAANDGASGFVSRLLVLCVSLVNVITYGTGIRNMLFTQAAVAQVQLPVFVASSEWHRSERCYLGVFADWASPLLPHVSSPANLLCLKEPAMAKLKAILERCFAMGFASASRDRCQLLFSSWSGISMFSVQGWTKQKDDSFPRLRTETEDLPRRFLEIHDDICVLQMRLNGNSSGNASVPSPLRVKTDLQNMLKRVELFLDLLLASYVVDDDKMTQDIPVAAYTLLATVPIYISICISGFTRPGKDYFSTVLSKIAARQTKRRRSYSSESEHVSSDADSLDSEDFESDACADALARLRECCDAFGTAPIHPDFLAVGSRLREGISFQEAQDASHTALRCMGKIISATFSQHKKYLKLAIKVGQKPSENVHKRIGLGLNLYQWFNHEPAASSVLGPYSYPDDREWKVDIERVCNLEVNSLDRIFDGSTTKNVEQAKEAWCPNAAQRLIGQLQDQGQLVGGWEASAAELRAGGEWELLLAETLTLSCLDSDVDGASGDSMPSDAVDFLISSQKWRTICTASVSHIMPAAALLRFSLAKTGRKPHPFSFQENNQDPFDVAPLQLTEPLSEIPETSPRLRETVFETISLLSRLCTEGDDNLTTCCHSIASQLVIDSQSFSELESLQAIRFAFIGLGLIRSMAESSSSEKSTDALTFVIERLTSVIEDYGRFTKAGDDSGFSRLFTFLGGPPSGKLDTIVKSDVHPFSILNVGGLQDVVDFDDALPYSWKSPQMPSKAISDLVSLLLAPLPANRSTRSCIALLLGGLCRLEFDMAEKLDRAATVVEAVVGSFNTADQGNLMVLFEKDFCFMQPPGSDTVVETTQLFQKHLSLLLVHLLSSKKEFIHTTSLYELLMRSFQTWLKLEPAFRDNILGVLSIFSCKLSHLHDVGDQLIVASESSAEEHNALDSLVRFFDFVRQLQMLLQHGSQQAVFKVKDESTNSRAATNNEGEGETKQISPRCSYVTKSGFHGQHWYNCYTCGLVWDKGCCTLCALVCHKDHDVSYSRHSSFFCDCGAEDGSANERNRVSCKCLTSLTPQHMEAIFEPEKLSSVLSPSKPSVTSLDINSPSAEHNDEKNELTSVCARIAVVSFKDDAKLSIEKFATKSCEGAWHKSLFTTLQKAFEVRKISGSKGNLGNECFSSALHQGDRKRLSYDHLRRVLKSRKAKPLDLQPLIPKSLVPVRAVSKGFQVKPPTDDSTASRLTSKASQDTMRSMLVADSRGRIVIAEQSSLLFCYILPAISVRYARRAFETTLPRSGMCILGSSPVKFSIAGMKLCKANERRLIVWGITSVCVVFLLGNKVAETIDLVDPDRQDDESDSILKCEWVSGVSQPYIAVATSQHIRIYDIAQSDSEKRTTPICRYNLGFEAKIRDFCFVSFKDCGDVLDSYQLDNVFAHEGKLNMLLLLENGRLHNAELKINPSEKLRRRDRYLDLGGGIAFPTSGVCLHDSSPADPPGSTLYSLGNASNLTFLVQSRLLLYKCDASPVVAFMFDSKGEIEGSFELLPHSIPLEMLENCADGHSIVGPFTYWTELGTLTRDSQTYFRVCCVGKSTRTDQPKLIYVEFNHVAVFVREIQWPPSTSMGLGLSLNLSYDGVAAFSAPYLYEESNHPSFGERAFCCVLTSSGSLLMFGEESVDVALASTESENCQIKSISAQSSTNAMQTPPPTFPLTLFEKLKNISDSDHVVFGGDGIGSDSDDLKTRLTRDSGVFLMCPRREGCTLAISFRPSKATNSACNTERQDERTGQLVIAALRILVGSTSSDCIPKTIHVQGRPVELSPGTKKWYSLPLTSEEIALAVRSGIVSVSIGPAFDSSSNPLVDSIEVYAADRQNVDWWLPKSEPMSQASLCAPADCQDRQQNHSTVVDSDDVALSARALTYLHQTVKSGDVMSDSDRNFLKLLIQEAALDHSDHLSFCIENLLERLEPNERVRQSFRDECILLGCSKALRKSREILISSAAEVPSSKWNAVKSVLYNLYAAASIARERPMNYLQSMDSIVGSGISSVAVDSSDILLKGLKNSAQYEDILGGIGGLADLALTEMAISLNTDTPHCKHFAKFDLLRSLLLHKNGSIVQRSCEAISTFCLNHSGGKRTGSSGHSLFMLLEHARLVAYRCDSCGVCPMKEIRFTVLVDGFDIDLCKSCYELGNAYAESQNFSAKKNVVINGKEVGGDTEKITCAQMKQMEPVSLQTLTLEQGEINSDSHHRRSPSKDSFGSDEELQAALRLSLGQDSNNGTNEADLPIGHREYEHFVGRLFGNILELFTSILRRDRHGSRLSMLARLLLDLSRHSRNLEAKAERTKRLAKEFANGASYLIGSSGAASKMTADATLTLIVCLRALFNLVSSEMEAKLFFSQTESSNKHISTSASNENEHPRLVCDVHNVFAVRRRCARGVHKDRRFYVCGKDRGSRCKFFMWADDITAKSSKKSKAQASFYNSVKEYIWDIFSSGNSPLHLKLCSMLEAEILDDSSNELDPSFSHSEESSDNASQGHSVSPSDIDDYFDGVWCSRQKLTDAMDVNPMEMDQSCTPCGLIVSADTLMNRGAVLVNVSLDLMAHIADHRADGISRWFSFLCEVASSANKPVSLRTLAKKVLKSLCKGDRSLYHSVRDHFAFGFQMRGLLKASSTIMDAALMIKEKARVCDDRWEHTEAYDWSNLRFGDLIGTQELISEDDYPLKVTTRMKKLLNDLSAVISSRGASWRHFCGLLLLPNSGRRKHDEFESRLSSVAPIVLLFWIACSSSEANQVHLLNIIDQALIDWKHHPSTRSKMDYSNTNQEPTVPTGNVFTATGFSVSTPEKILLDGDKKLNVSDIASFAMHFIFGGRTTELRRVAYQVATKLCLSLSLEDKSHLFRSLINPSFFQVGSLGKSCIEYLNFLQFLVPLVSEKFVQVRTAADLVLSLLLRQNDVMKLDRSNGNWSILEMGSGPTSVKKRFDLTSCAFCLRVHNAGAKPPQSKSPSSAQSSDNNRRESSDPSPVSAPTSALSQTLRSKLQTQRQWDVEQVCPFSRGRLDSGKETSSSNEFCIFFSLKYRLVISDIFLTIGDPRGRFVKTINVYFSPRPVDDVANLKSGDYADLWQPCAVIKLTRGASRASTALAYPVVASNLKIEFTDFYDRPGGSKASDGSLLVHCPRCARVVTNAHGVCGNCGEVAFQCRKCRHINYDRLDAFLCVECGYCTSGTFAFELNAGVVSNAVAITNDNDYRRCAKLLGTATSIYEELTDELRKKTQQAIQQDKTRPGKIDSSFNAALRRAFQGMPPVLISGDGSSDSTSLQKVGKQGSVVKFIAHPQSNHTVDRSSTAADRTRSLLRLARQIRSEAGVGSDRRRSSDVIIRHLGRGLAFDGIDDDGDFFGLLDGGSLFDQPDPLSRAMASAQSRLRNEGGGDPLSSGRQRVRFETADVNSGGLKNESAKELMTECRKLYLLMRESDREISELSRRLRAWKRLQTNALGINEKSVLPAMPPVSAVQPIRLHSMNSDMLQTVSFSPSHCSVCSGMVALQLLVLWLRIFSEFPHQVQIVPEFLSMLLEDSSAAIGSGVIPIGGIVGEKPKTYQDHKHDAIIQIATETALEGGARLVLEEIRKQLSTGNNLNCAEILGKILQVPSSSFLLSDEYTTLTMQTLEASRAATTE